MMKKTYIPLVVVILLILGLALQDILAAMAERPIAYVRRLKPQVDVFNSPKSTEAEQGEPLFNGDTLVTDDNGYAAVQFMDKSIGKVKPGSRLVMNGEVGGPDNTSGRISLELGEIFMEVTGRSDSDFEIVTSSAVASVKGTEFGASHNEYFWVEEGIVEILSTETGDTATLTELRYGQVNDDGSITTGDLSRDELDELNEGFDDQDNMPMPRTLKLRFRNDEGELREIEIIYFEN